jgi:hypothetical protein
MIMAWLGNNWIWILVGVAFIAFHLFGHRMHGGHGTHGRGEQTPPPASGKRELEVTDDRSENPHHPHHRS